MFIATLAVFITLYFLLNSWMLAIAIASGTKSAAV